MKKKRVTVGFDINIYKQVVKATSSGQGGFITQYIVLAVREKLERQKDLPEVRMIIKKSPYPVVMTSLEGFTVAVSKDLEKLCDRREKDFLGKKPGHVLRSGRQTSVGAAAAVKECRINTYADFAVMNYLPDGSSYLSHIYLRRVCYYILAVESAPSWGYDISKAEARAELERLTRLIQEAAG